MNVSIVSVPDVLYPYKPTLRPVVTAVSVTVLADVPVAVIDDPIAFIENVRGLLEALVAVAMSVPTPVTTR